MDNKTYKELMKERQKLASKIRRQMQSARLYQKYGGRKSKYRNEAVSNFYGQVDEEFFKKKKTKGVIQKGQQLYTERELKTQIEQMEQMLEDEEIFVSNYDSLSDDTVISWKDNGYDDDKNHIFMKDIQEQWDSAGESGDNSDYPTWISVFNLLSKGANESITVGDIKAKLQDASLDPTEKTFLRTLFSQINQPKYYKGRI